jgi:pentatricopeptide repeat protein
MMILADASLSVNTLPQFKRHGSLVSPDGFPATFLRPKKITSRGTIRSVAVTPLKSEATTHGWFSSPSHQIKLLRIQLNSFAGHGHVICRGREEEAVEKSQVEEKNKHEDVGLLLLNEQQQNSIRVYAGFLQMCVKTDTVTGGKKLHAHIIKRGFEAEEEEDVMYVEHNLITMYAKLNSVVDARKVFDRMPNRNTVSWTAMISGYAKSSAYGHGEEALKLFVAMRQSGVHPNEFTLMSVLIACIQLVNLQQGKQIHGHIIRTGFDSHIHINNALANMYAKCGDIKDSRQVFDKMSKRDTVSWNTMIAGYSQHGLGGEALEIFAEMHQAGIRPEQFAFSSVIMAIASLSSSSPLEQGKHVHAYIVKTGFELNVTVNNALVTMYAKCGNIEFAARVFNKMPRRDVISWTGMITGCAHHGQVNRAFQLFQEMPEQERNSVSYSAMIAGFAKNGEGENALQLFSQMQPCGIHPNHFTLASVINACADLAAKQHGRQLHAHIVKTGFESDLCIGSALIDMYAKCGIMVDAQKVFVKMPERNIVSWTGMITGYAQNGQGEDALNLFGEMQKQEHHGIGFETMDKEFTLASVIGACGTLGAMGEGKCFHADILKCGLAASVGIGNALITMYAKCGSIEDSLAVFSKMHNQDRDVVSWNAMIAGFSQHGRGKEALQLFQQMQEAGTKPNGITFIGVLSACKSARLVDEGRDYFNSMSKDYGITPGIEHYVCMVDILGCVGCMDEAEDFVNRMPSYEQEDTTLVWKALFRASRIHCNVDLAKRAAEIILASEPQDPATFALVANIYASIGWWDDATIVRRMMKNRGFKKLPARSWIFEGKKLHSFLSRDRTHPRIEEIHAKLDELIRQTKAEGYEPDTSFVLHDIEPHHQEHFLTYHSEKLVVAFGLLTTPLETPIRVIKNIRICGDCHTFTKFVSKIVGKEIILRDGSCFHYFKAGHCSCGDYW